MPLNLRSHSPLSTGTAWRVALLVFVSSLAAPQALLYAQNGSYVKPGLSVGEFYDDNLFMVPQPTEGDLVSRVSPALDVGYRTPRGHLTGLYTFDAEIYPHHQLLNNPFVRQDASTDIQYLITPNVSFTTTASYERTHTPQELNLTTGLALGRFEADRILVNPKLTAQVNGRTRLLLDYLWDRDALVDTLSSRMNRASIRLERQTTATTMFGVGYELWQFGFNTDRSRSHVALVGMSHRFSPLTRLEIWAGPRVSDGAVQPEATATFTHQLPHGTMALSYQRQQATSLGEALPLNVQNVTLNLSDQISERVAIAVTPGFFETTIADTRLLVYLADSTLTVHMTPQLAFVMSYQYTSQRGTFGSLNQTIPHQVALFSFVVTPLRGVEF